MSPHRPLGDVIRPYMRLCRGRLFTQSEHMQGNREYPLTLKHCKPDSVTSGKSSVLTWGPGGRQSRRTWWSPHGHCSTSWRWPGSPAVIEVFYRYSTTSTPDYRGVSQYMCTVLCLLFYTPSSRHGVSAHSQSCRSECSSLSLFPAPWLFWSSWRSVCPDGCRGRTLLPSGSGPPGR